MTASPPVPIPTPLPTRYLSTREAAAYIGHSPGTLANWRSAGGRGLKSYKVPGGKVLYSVADLDALVRGAAA